jgi:hypothetical protein
MSVFAVLQAATQTPIVVDPVTIDVGPGPFWSLGHIANTAAAIVTIVTCLTLIFFPVVRRIRRLVTWLEFFQADWVGEPDRPGVRGHSGVMERLALIDGEFSNDGNGSLRASVDRLTGVVGGVADRAAAMETRQKQVQIVINDTADRLTRSIKVREQIIKDMTANGEAVWKALDAVGAEMPPFIDPDRLER